MADRGFSVTITAQDRATQTLDRLNKRLVTMNAPVHRLQKSFGRLAESTGLRDVGRALGNIERSSAGIFANIGRAVPGLAALGGMLGVAGLAEGTRQAGEYGTNLLLTARRAGVGVENLQRFGNATAAVGGNADSAMQSLASLRKSMEMAAFSGNGDSKFTAALLSLPGGGVKIEDRPGHLRNTLSVAYEALRKLASMKDRVEQTRFGDLIFGPGFDSSLFRATWNHAKSFGQFMDAGRRMPVLSERQVEALNKQQVATTRLSREVKTLAFQIGSDLAPAEVKAAGGLADWIEQNQKWLASDISGDIQRVVREINAAVKAMGGWNNTSTALFELWASRFAPGILKPLMKADALLRLLEGYGKSHHIPGVGEVANTARGAATGAAIGSLVPGVGTAAGAGAGAFVGATWWLDPFGLNDVTPAQALHYLTTRRGIRNNNPLNLSYARGEGAIGSDGRFARFKTMQGGVAADARELLRYQDAYHLNTVAGIVHRWAPPGENDTGNYIQFVAHRMGVSAGTRLNLHDPATLERLTAAMASFESGGVSKKDLHEGVLAALAPSRQGGGPAVHLASPGPRAVPVQHTVKGAATVHVNIAGAPPGSRVSAQTAGDLFVDAPKVVMPMPAGGGPVQ